MEDSVVHLQVKTYLIKRFMLDHKINEIEFCHYCNITFQMYQKLMSNLTNQDMLLLYKVANLMGIEAYKLIY